VVLVPIADVAATSVVDVVGTAVGCCAGWSAGVVVETGAVEEGGGGGGGGGGDDVWAVVVCICDVSSAAVDVVTAGGAAVDVSVVLEVVRAVRARERVHRLPFTVVIDC
jgi:uncharacterized spore protein YtfJ